MACDESNLVPPGAIGNYVHAGGKIGVLVEVSCESNLVAATSEFQELLHDLAMHIAASNPKFVRRDDVAPEAYERQREIYRAQAQAMSKPPALIAKIVEGKMSRFYEEVCLIEQPFVKDQTISVQHLIDANSRKLGEKIAIRRFVRFKVGERLTNSPDDRPPEPTDDAGVPATKPQGPKPRSGSVAAGLD